MKARSSKTKAHRHPKEEPESTAPVEPKTHELRKRVTVEAPAVVPATAPAKSAIKRRTEASAEGFSV